MSDTPFIHLHCHSDYSLLDGACEVSDLVKTVAEQQSPAVALTDHGNLFGAVKFYNTAREKGVKPIIGCEVYVSQKGMKVKSDADRYNHLVLLCENQEGYRNLIDLVSTAYLEGFYYKPRIDKDLLSRHSKGLIALSACLRGDVNETILLDRYDDAKRLALTYQDMFGPQNFFLEVQDHCLDQDKKLIPQVVRMSSETGIPLVATNDAHYVKRDDARCHEIMLCIQTGKTMNDPARMHWDQPVFYLKSRAEMMQNFGEIEHALDRTWDIAQRCEVKLEKVKNPFPKFDVPEGHSTDTYFEWVARQGFEKRRVRLEAYAAQGRLKHPLQEYAERLDREIKIIQQMKFPGYFLIVWDFIRYAKSMGIPVGPGRGSAAGSLVAYAMGITDVDPLQFELLFERFLNPERVSFPDVDVDFCTNRRGQVIQYVTEKYGREQVAQIITFGTLGARAAIKDVGRVLGMTFAEVDPLTKMVPAVLNITLEEAIKQEPGFQEAAKKDPRVKDILDVALRLEGKARNCGVHAAGVVISPVPLKELVPLYRTNKEEIVTQFEMSALEKLSLLKMDFLGLTTLTIVDNAVKLIEKHRGVKLVIDDIPLDDKKTYQDIFSKAFTSGVFQFESPGMRDMLRRYQPERLEDLCALNALYRPGPIQGGMTDDFIERKWGRKEVVYDIPELKGLLEETYGVIVYQEQVMQIANRLAGYSLGEADLLRRAMGKKKLEEMAKQRERFIKGALERNFPRKKVEKIFDLMEQFAGYGFNKSHSAAYGYLAYVTGYLKAHYPIEFMAALLTSETGNTAKVVKYINECRDMGIKVLPPDVNTSDWDFTPDGDAIRFGLGPIKNVGQSGVAAVQKARQEGGKFTSLYQFCERVDLAQLNRRMMENLIKAGALDSLAGNRPQMMAALDGAMDSGQRAQRDRESGQTGLFASMFQDQDTGHAEQPLPDVNDWPTKEKLGFEKEVLGLYVSGHPLDAFMDKVSELATHNSDTLEGLEKGNEVKLCGVLTSIQRRRNKEGKPWSSMLLEDRNGAIEALLFTTNYERLQTLLKEDAPVLVTATALPEEGGGVKVSIQEIVPLEHAYVRMPALISIRVRLPQPGGTGPDPVDELSALIQKKPGKTSVRLRLDQPREFSVIMDISQKVYPDKVFKREIERICGPEALEVLAG